MRLLHTTGHRDINEVEFELPQMKSDQIKIQTKLCGICRSDIAAYAGWENPMPLGMQGHEGLGIVIEVGKDFQGPIKIGDIVSTISDPAYGDFYYAKNNEAVVVDSIHPSNILQPVACAMNIYFKLATYIKTNDPILLIGSGFMSVIIAQYIKTTTPNQEIIVCGNSNISQWSSLGITLCSITDMVTSKRKFKYIIDLSSKAENFEIISKHIGDVEAIICYAATPFSPVITNFFESCWNCHTFIMPSPRNSDFHNIMTITRFLIKDKIINPDFLWTQSYNRYNMDSVKRGFEDGVNRSQNYVRGYIKW